MKVLSLFDGISCGQVALQRANVSVDQFFASEIDEKAIKVTQHHHPDTIQVGSVSDLKGSDFPQIDLLMGGSPCQGFSFAGKKLNFEDPRSKLFFEFLRIKEELNPKFFLLENVRMKKEISDCISELLGVKPVLINSGLVSAQSRPRLYWTNIPFELPQNRNLFIKDVLDEAGDHSFVDQSKLVNCRFTKNYLQYDPNNTGHNGQCHRAYYLTSKIGTLTTFDLSKIYYPDGTVRRITVLEAERFQTLPEGYTNLLKRSQAIKAIGNGWTVDVISNFFNNL